MERHFAFRGPLALALCLASTVAFAQGPRTAKDAKSLPPPKGAIWADDADDWVIEPFLGNNTAGTFLPGPAVEAGFGAAEERVYGMVFDGDGNVLVACEMFVAQADKAGNLRYVAGIPGVFVGPRCFLVVWQDGWNGDGGDSNILGVRVTPEGKVLDRKPLAICTAPGIQESPAVAWTGKESFVVWSDLRNRKDSDMLLTVYERHKPDGAIALTAKVLTAP